MSLKRLTALLLVLAVLLSGSSALAADPDALTRGEACQMLLEAAAAYRPGLTPGDLLRGDGTGALREDAPVTRAQALVMLDRAFGGLLAAEGDAARMAPPAAFADLPAWNCAELDRALAAGIVAGVSETSLAPDASMTAAQLRTLVRRVYAVLGERLEDDFYAAVNRDLLTSALPAGKLSAGSWDDLSDRAAEALSAVLGDCLSGSWADGTPQHRIAGLYASALDWETRDALGIAPIQAYLDAAEAAGTVAELLEVNNRLLRETGLGVLLSFSLTPDPEDGSAQLLRLSCIRPLQNAAFYGTDGPAKDAYLRYIASLLTLGGTPADEARRAADRFWEAEASLSAAAAGGTARSYSLDQLRSLLPGVELAAVCRAQGLSLEGPVLEARAGDLAAAATLFTLDRLPELKLLFRVTLLGSAGNYLGQDFRAASSAYQAAVLGSAPTMDDEATAMRIVQAYLPDDMGALYAAACCDETTVRAVEAMARDLVEVFKTRIRELDWMSDATKAMAVRKLDALGIRVGAPDYDLTAGPAIRTPEQGGSFFGNLSAILLARQTNMAVSQHRPIDKTPWGMPPYEADCIYEDENNSITIPAAILQPPMYDPSASYEENLGGIGFMIAHEITHAFDDNGAQYDASGSRSNWWTPEDYAAFQSRCETVAAYYDGLEAAPGLPCDGVRTLSENIADLGAAACVTEAASRLEAPDYAALYRAIARTWASTTTRQAAVQRRTWDVHAPKNLRCNRAVQSCDAFYEAFGIKPGDGMYLPPEQRAAIW